MEKIFETTHIIPNNNKLFIQTNGLNNKQINLNEQNKNEFEYIQHIFNKILKKKITKIKRSSNDKILIELIDHNKNRFATIIHNYSYIKTKPYTKLLQKRLFEFKLEKFIKNIKKNTKVDPLKIVLAGSLISTATMVIVGQIPNEQNIETEMKNVTVEYDNNVFSGQLLNNEVKISPAEKIPDNINYEDSDYIRINNNDINIYSINDNSNNASNNNLDFNNISNFTTYEEYIEFASKLYYVDYEVAKELVTEKFNTFKNPELGTSELKRMIDLKEKGIINGDLNVIGIFITVKDYAIDYLKLDEQNAIVSEKSSEERERDLIGVAKNIYGIDNTDLLNTIIAIHRIETGYGQTKLTIEKNNLGGNLNPKYPDNPTPNIYKTTEIGSESMVRNFLNIYNKCMYNETCNILDPTPVFLSKLYCTHTPKNWAESITNMLREGKIQQDVESYLNDNSKVY